ncbi:hypothetical protein NXT08_22380 [Rhodococcus pyridinivorans]|uniref:hypothetical protein n=1 Tax=Rhodococcus pyridinivorans TaxID=103816 RepID=UPI002164A1DE|nr:hypothetical protein [Rhodococcus pyridinivorans]UVT24951.1 hypothetical protein NXT08_22380 [Rhodococcus pyridinivorans]
MSAPIDGWDLTAEITRCGTCRADIVWASTEKGNAIPVEPASTPNGNLMLSTVAGVRLAAVVKGSRRDALAAAGVPLYLSHFVSCPQASQWRNR